MANNEFRISEVPPGSALLVGGVAGRLNSNTSRSRPICVRCTRLSPARNPEATEVVRSVLVDSILCHPTVTVMSLIINPSLSVACTTDRRYS
jgi:hypothetical protein